jgi:hypothetical protein
VRRLVKRGVGWHSAGPRAFTVRWESGIVQTRPQGCAACSLIPEDEITLARTALGLAEEGSA